MFKILEVIYNIMTAFFGAGWMFIVSVFTGKMPKVSVYHWSKDLYVDTGIDITSDKYIKTHRTDLVSNECKNKIIGDFIDHLLTDENFMNPCNNTNFNLYKDGKKIGETTVHNVLIKSKNEYIKNINDIYQKQRINEEII